MQNILTLETNKYAIKIENFEGPLDLLCHLIDKNKMNINDIKLSEIADQYIEYINKMEEMNLEITSEFLVMASTLIYLWGRRRNIWGRAFKKNYWIQKIQRNYKNT